MEKDAIVFKITLDLGMFHSFLFLKFCLLLLSRILLNLCSFKLPAKISYKKLK